MTGIVILVLGVQLLGLVWNLWRHAYGFATYNVRLPPAPLPLKSLGWSPVPGQEIVILLAILGLAMIGTAVLWPSRGTAIIPERIRRETFRHPNGAISENDSQTALPGAGLRRSDETH